MDERHEHEILAVNYVNGRVVCRSHEERPLLEALAKGTLKTPLPIPAVTAVLGEIASTRHRHVSAHSLNQTK